MPGRATPWAAGASYGRPSGQPREVGQTAAGVRPKADTFDSRVMALKLPTSGTAPTLVQPESRAALLTCLGRQMGAHPPAADEVLLELPSRALSAPSSQLCTAVALCECHHPLGNGLCRVRLSLSDGRRPKFNGVLCSRILSLTRSTTVSGIGGGV